MKFQCLNPKCKRTCMYPVKMILELNSSTLYPSNSKEFHACPYCDCLNIDEYVELQPQITSVISVATEEADTKIKEGYVVRDVYAKSVTLVKLEKKERKKK